MTALVTQRKAGFPTKFKPGEPKKADAKADAVIEYAKKARDWPLLLEAVETPAGRAGPLVRAVSAGLVFPHRGNRRALILAQGLDGQPGVPKVHLGHGDRRLGQRRNRTH